MAQPNVAPAACPSIPKLAIACQGGGAHTAFTAGVLAYFFMAFQHFEDNQKPLPVELVGLSGTSGGAITAAMAWSNPGKTSEPWAEGARRVLRYWQLNKAISGTDNPEPLWWWEGAANAWAQWLAPLGNVFPKVEMPANGLISSMVQQRMTADMKTTLGDACQNGDISGRPGMRLYVGACDIVNQRDETKDVRPDSAFVTFPEHAKAPLTIPQLLASAAIPQLFAPVPVTYKGETRYFWDGLFSQNPPINSFFSGKDPGEKPDLLWVIQINPSRYESKTNPYPTRPLEIDDRRNELIGNLSLGHELHTIETINALYFEPPEGLKNHKPVTYCFIPMGEIDGQNLEYASKLNRDPAFIDSLIRAGMRKAYELARDGSLFKADCHARDASKPKVSFANPMDWPSPQTLAAYLRQEPDLLNIWQA